MKPTPTNAKTKQNYTDSDTPWKGIITRYLAACIAFFYSDIYAAIDWSKPIEFLDKELQQIAVDAQIGRKLADVLVKVFLLDGSEVWILIHIEVQGKRDPDFQRRMFIYFYRIYDKYGHQVISLAILADTNKKWKPTRFKSMIFGSGVEFRFRPVKLLDYKDKIDELETSDNPFAVVVLAHLQTQATKRNMQDRYAAKFRLMRLMYERGRSKEEIRELFRFIDWIMILPEELATQFKYNLHTYEESRKMPFITQTERLWLNEGIEKGVGQGQQQGISGFMLQLLSQRLGQLPAEIQGKIQSLSVEQLQQLGSMLFNLKSLSELNDWLQQHPGTFVPIELKPLALEEEA